MKFSTILICSVVSAGGFWATATAAEPAGFAAEYELLKEFPAGRLGALTAAGKPDAAGLVGSNRKGFLEAGMQRGALWYLMGALTRDDLAAADDAWRAVDVAFDHQQADGGFEMRATPEHPSDYGTQTFRVQSTFFFIQELTHAILVIQESPHEAHFRRRVSQVEPKIRRACEFICAGYGTIIANSSQAPNRLVIAAKALGLAGVILDDERFKAAAHDLLREALNHRFPDGVFIEKGGRDTSYNTVSVMNGEELALHLPCPELQNAFDGAVQWELSRILPSGEMATGGNSRTAVGKETYMGAAKGVNYHEIIIALTYYGLMHHDPAALAGADKIYRWAYTEGHSSH